MSTRETGKLLDSVAMKTQEEDQQASAEEWGKPCRIHRVSPMDLATLGVVLISMTLAAITIFNKPAAVFLGQKHQLQVIGFLVSVMSFCSARQILKSSLVYEERAGRSTLQNFDALLRSDTFSTTASVGPRSVLLFLFCLPLGLSAAYKSFLGGSTSRVVPSTSVPFGFTAAPGYQLIGNGLSLLVNIYLPFWSIQQLGRSYGFNLYVLDNQTAAVLDGPLPSYVIALQKTLSDSEFMIMTAEVQATVSQSMNPSASERNDTNYWTTKRGLFPDTSRKTNNFSNVGQEMWFGAGSEGRNYTETFLSTWNTTLNQTFNSQAERFVTTRGTCTGTWNITNSNITLNGIENLQAGNGSSGLNQSIIQNEDLPTRDMFFSFVGEYDPVTRVAWNQPFALTGSYFPAANMRPSLVASMLWARITSGHGPERAGPRSKGEAYDSASYNVESSRITMTKGVTTLLRSYWLMFIMAIHPVLTIIAMLGKAVLHTTPIGDNFGVISLLAGVTGSTSKSLQGAALSGTLTRDVPITFISRKNPGSWYERLELDVGSREKSSKLRPRTLYG